MQVSKDPDYFYENMEIHVKISMDGAQYSRSSSFCLLSFSIFNREYTLSPASKFLAKNCENPYYMNEYMYTDMHTVAVMQAEETYGNLAMSFQSVFGEINNMVKNPVLTIYEQSYNVIFYLCCDYKVCNNNIYTHNKMLYK